MDAGPRTAMVIAGGDPVDPSVRDLLPHVGDVDFVIAADSGLDRAVELGLDVDLVVGDFDSADPAAVDAAVRRGTELERHPSEKDAIDLELAIDAARPRIFVVRHEITVCGRSGDRLSLLPVHGPALRVVTEGLRYPLVHEDLPAGTSRGCSNELVAETARVALEEGTLLCVLPGPD